MASAAARSLLYFARVNSHARLSPPAAASRPFVFCTWETNKSLPKLSEQSRRSYYLTKQVVKASSAQNDGIVPANDDDPEDGVSLGTMKLPSDVDLQRFETLLFQVPIHFL